MAETDDILSDPTPMFTEAEKNMEEEKSSDDQELKLVFFIFLFLQIGTISRQIALQASISFPYHLLVLLFGMCVGYVTQMGQFVGQIASQILDFDNQIETSLLINLVIPIAFFDAAYNIQVDDLKFIFLHISCVIFPILITTLTVVAYVGVLYFPYKFEIADYALVMALTVMPTPGVTRSFTMPIVFMISYVLKCIQSIGIGFLCGKVAIYWISRIFQDPVIQVCVALSSVYVAYNTCQLLGTPGFYSTLVIGLQLKTAICPTFPSQMFNSHNRVVLFVFANVTLMLGGLNFQRKVFPVLEPVDLLYNFAIFCMVFGIRFMIFTLLQPIYKRYYYYNWDRLKIMAMTVCNLRGNYAVLLCLSLDDYVKKDPKVKNQLFMVAMLQVLMSFMINTPFSSLAMIKTNQQFSGEKVLMLHRAARSMNNLRAAAMQGLKSSVFTADADWDLVHANTMLRHEFFKMYKAGKHVKKIASKSSSFYADYNYRQTVDRKQVTSEAIKQMVFALRTHVKSQLHDGVLSKDGHINLNILTTEALEKRHLVDPCRLIKMKQPVAFMWRLETDCRRIRHEGHLWPPYIFVLYCVFLSDIVFNIHDLSEHIFLDDRRSVYYTAYIYYSVAFLAGYTLIYILKMIYRGSFRPKSCFDYFDIFIITLTLVDQSLTLYPYADLSFLGLNLPVKVSWAILTAFSASRFIRLLKVVHFSPMMLSWLESYLDQLAFIGVDICRGFALATLDAQKKVPLIVQDKDVGGELKAVCQKSRLAMSQRLCLVQMLNPGVVSALTTRYATRLTLNGLDSLVHDLQKIVVLEELDAALLRREIKTKMIKMKKSPFTLQPKSYRRTIQHISWLDGEPELVENILREGALMCFRANHVIIAQGRMPPGVYIIMSGIVRIEAKKEEVPAATGSSFSTPSEEQDQLIDFLTVGHEIGIMSFLNGRPEPRTMRCASSVEAFFISRADLARLINYDPEPTKPMTQVEEKMWKTVSLVRAIRIMHYEMPNPELSRSELMYRLADSYIVDGNLIHSISMITPDIGAVLLVHGHAKDIRSYYTGPCIVPLSAGRLDPLPHRGPRVVILVIRSNLSILRESDLNAPARWEVAAEENGERSIFEKKSSDSFVL